MAEQDTVMRSVEEEEEELMAQRTTGGGERQIQIHPLVLMNVADHFTRQKRIASQQQVIGALFGIQNGLDVSVFDSFEMKYDVVHGDIQIDKEFLSSRIQQCTFAAALDTFHWILCK